MNKSTVQKFVILYTDGTERVITGTYGEALTFFHNEGDHAVDMLPYNEAELKDTE